GRRTWLTLAGAATGEGSQHGVDEAADAGLSSATGERHGVVDRGEGGDALEEDDLVGRHAQERERARVEIVDASPRVRGEDPVEVTLPAERPVDQLRRKRDVARRDSSVIQLAVESEVGVG